MFTRILVPLDGSERAERALPVAARLARQSGGAVILTQVVTPSTGYGPPFDSYVPQPTRVDDQLVAAQTYLQEVAKRPKLTGVQTEMVVMSAVGVAPALLELVGTQHADLAVMCRHGRSGLARWALGSVAQKVARAAPVPVLVLHAEGPIPARPHQDAERPLCVLVPLDGSPLAETAITPAAQLVAGLAAPAAGALHLLHVITDVVTTSFDVESAQEVPREAMESAKTYLRSVAERFKQKPLGALNLQVTWSAAFDADVAAALIDVAEGREDVEGAGVFGRCDLIAMATHGRSGLRLWAMGSVTDRVLQRSQLPLLVVRPKNADQQDQSVLEQKRQPSGTAVESWQALF
jgi:nucleotide-binding universal stress UspA family protein